MKKRWIIIAALYLYPEFLAVMLPMLLNWTGIVLPSAVDDWLNANYLFAATLIFLVPTLILLAVGFLAAASSLKRPPIPAAESVDLLRTQTIMRLVQIPGYILILAVSLLCLLFIFTVGFSIFFFIMDAASVIITGLFSIPVYASLYRNGQIGRSRAVCYSILSFVFCANAIVSIVCCKQVKAGRSLGGR